MSFNNVIAAENIAENARERRYTVLSKIKTSCANSESSNFDISCQIEELWKAAEALINEDRREESRNILELILDLMDDEKTIQTKKNVFIKASSAYELGIFFMSIGSNEDASSYFDIACTNYESLGASSVIEYASASANCGFALYNMNSNDEAISYIENAYFLLNSLDEKGKEKNSELITVVSDFISLLYLEEGRKEEANDVLDKSTKDTFPLLLDNEISSKRPITPPVNESVMPIGKVSTSRIAPRNRRVIKNPRIAKLKPVQSKSSCDATNFEKLGKAIADLCSK